MEMDPMSFHLDPFLPMYAKHGLKVRGNLVQEWVGVRTFRTHLFYWETVKNWKNELGSNRGDGSNKGQARPESLLLMAFRFLQRNPPQFWPEELSLSLSNLILERLTLFWTWSKINSWTSSEINLPSYSKIYQKSISFLEPFLFQVPKSSDSRPYKQTNKEKDTNEQATTYKTARVMSIHGWIRPVIRKFPQKN